MDVSRQSSYKIIGLNGINCFEPANAKPGHYEMLLSLILQFLYVC